MKIGNWKIDTVNKKIIWRGKGKSEIELDKKNFFGLGLDNFMNQIIYICEKDVVNDSDIFAFNSALMCAFEVFEINKPEGFSFSEMINKQIKIISEKGSNTDEIVL